jgi:hypothetical protein
MFSLSFEPLHKVLRLDFTGLSTTQDLKAIDRAVVRFLGGFDRVGEGIRSLYDMTEVAALAVPHTRFEQRASKRAIGNLERIVVAPPWAGEDFGASYRKGRELWRHVQPIIVRTLAEAHGLLNLLEPRFVSVD